MEFNASANHGRRPRGAACAERGHLRRARIQITPQITAINTNMMTTLIRSASEEIEQ